MISVVSLYVFLRFFHFRKYRKFNWGPCNAMQHSGGWQMPWSAPEHFQSAQGIIPFTLHSGVLQSLCSTPEGCAGNQGLLMHDWYNIPSHPPFNSVTDAVQRAAVPHDGWVRQEYPRCVNALQTLLDCGTSVVFGSVITYWRECS